MKYYFLILLFMLSCNDGCNNSEVEITTKDTGNKTEELDPVARLEMDSFPAEDPKLAEKLSGYDKDSLLMRIRFQQLANTMDDAFQKGDVDTYLKFALPSIVKGHGGIEKMRSKYASDMKNNPQLFEKILSGPVSVLGEVLDIKGKSAGWYCLLPQRITFKNEGRRMQAEGLMVGYSPDSKACYFVDITNIADEKVYYLMPDLYHIVPELPTRGGVYALP